MRTVRWLEIFLLFISPLIALFLFQNQSGETTTWNAAIGNILLGTLIIFLFCLLWIENIEKSLQPRLQRLMKKLSDIFRPVNRKKQAGEDEKGLLQSSVSSSPSKPLLPSGKKSMNVKRKADEKKTVNWFENYDQKVGKRLLKAWRKVKGKNDKDAEGKMRILAMQLKTKNYGETDWVWRMINFFRPRSDGLQELQDEIQDRIDELDEDKQKEKGKTVEPIDKLPEDSDVPTSNDANDLTETLSKGVPHKPVSGEDVKSDEHIKEDNSLPSSDQGAGEAEETK